MVLRYDVSITATWEERVADVPVGYNGKPQAAVKFIHTIILLNFALRRHNLTL